VVLYKLPCNRSGVADCRSVKQQYKELKQHCVGRYDAECICRLAAAAAAAAAVSVVIKYVSGNGDGVP